MCDGGGSFCLAPIFSFLNVGNKLKNKMGEGGGERNKNVQRNLFVFYCFVLFFFNFKREKKLFSVNFIQVNRGGSGGVPSTITVYSLHLITYAGNCTFVIFVFANPFLFCFGILKRQRTELSFFFCVKKNNH